MTYLECPCCGDDGAESDSQGWFVDGQPLICGCPGWVSVDADEDPWINNGDAPCKRCEEPMKTECCGVAITADQRFCPKCGYEARVNLSAARPPEEPVP